MTVIFYEKKSGLELFRLYDSNIPILRQVFNFNGLWEVATIDGFIGEDVVKVELVRIYGAV